MHLSTGIHHDRYERSTVLSHRHGTDGWTLGEATGSTSTLLHTGVALTGDCLLSTYSMFVCFVTHLNLRRYAAGLCGAYVGVC